jgi:hypothetical protein
VPGGNEGAFREEAGRAGEIRAGDLLNFIQDETLLKRLSSSKNLPAAARR